jgi:hypothetical protein
MYNRAVVVWQKLFICVILHEWLCVCVCVCVCVWRHIQEALHAGLADDPGVKLWLDTGTGEHAAGMIGTTVALAVRPHCTVANG